jgi:hypothetical protein
MTEIFNPLLDPENIGFIDIDIELCCDWVVCCDNMRCTDCALSSEDNFKQWIEQNKHEE